MNGDGLNEVAEARSRSYWLLSELFLTAPSIAARDDLAARLEACQDSADEEWNALARELHRTLTEVPLEDLQREHTRLLGGLAPGYGPPPPYESVHRGEARVAGDATARVMRAYSEAGFGAIHPEAGPQDHIGVELRFMSLAAIGERDAWREGDRERGRALLERQHTFARDHLVAWVPGYCAVLREASRAAFYAALGTLTERVVTDDLTLIAELLAEARTMGVPRSDQRYPSAPCRR